jgi:hypothetical protein
MVELIIDPRFWMRKRCGGASVSVNQFLRRKGEVEASHPPGGLRARTDVLRIFACLSSSSAAGCRPDDGWKNDFGALQPPSNHPPKMGGNDPNHISAAESNHFYRQNSASLLCHPKSSSPRGQWPWRTRGMLAFILGIVDNQ